MVNKVEPFLTQERVSIKDAMKQMDKNGEKILFVVDSSRRLIGSLTDGDIRRWILGNGSLKETVERISNKNSRFVRVGYEIDSVKKLMLTQKLASLPVIDQCNRITNVLLWENVFSGRDNKQKEKLNIPVVIMAGGKGERLDPFTQILPKPLIPIGEEPIIKIIMDKFRPYGVKEFFVSLNHKSEMVKAYFKEMDPGYKINYITETKSLGTAGCLRNMIDKARGSVFVTNCDIIIDADYGEIVKFHLKGGYDITIVGSVRHYTIPYGICEIEIGGQLKQINEKPEYDFLINTGMYVITKGALSLIPKDKAFDMTELIKKAKANKMKVGVYPVSEKSWIDIGQWEEYRKAVEKLGGNK